MWVVPAPMVVAKPAPLGLFAMVATHGRRRAPVSGESDVLRRCVRQWAHCWRGQIRQGSVRVVVALKSSYSWAA